MSERRLAVELESRLETKVEKIWGIAEAWSLRAGQIVELDGKTWKVVSVYGADTWHRADLVEVDSQGLQ